jgi:hypothetical protein
LANWLFSSFTADLIQNGAGVRLCVAPLDESYEHVTYQFEIPCSYKRIYHFSCI